MSENRFKTKYYLKGRQGVVLGVVKVNEEENVLHWNEVVDLLNELSTSCRQLEGKIKRLNAFIVSKDLAIEYLKWNKKGDNDEE